MNDTMARPTVSVGGSKPNKPNPHHQRAARLLKGSASYEDRFIPNHEELKEVIAHLRSMGSVIVFTTGVWDLFHIGHAEYIQRGREEARKLYPDAEHITTVLGVDTDELTKIRKGPKRPIVPEGERCKILSQLRTVDLITLQYEPNQLYRVIEHDVRVISTSTQDLPEDFEDIKAQCEHLVNLPPQAETSTSARIRLLAMDGKLETLASFRDRFEKLFKEMSDELNT